MYNAAMLAFGLLFCVYIPLTGWGLVVVVVVVVGDRKGRSA